MSTAKYGNRFILLLVGAFPLLSIVLVVGAILAHVGAEKRETNKIRVEQRPVAQQRAPVPAPAPAVPSAQVEERRNSWVIPTQDGKGLISSEGGFYYRK